MMMTHIRQTSITMAFADLEKRWGANTIHQP